MPLSVLLPVVLVGLVMVIGASWWWATEAPALDEPAARDVFVDRTGIEPDRIVLSADGRGALVRHGSSVGAVVLVAGRPWVRERVQLHWSGDQVAIDSREWGSPTQVLAMAADRWSDVDA